MYQDIPTGLRTNNKVEHKQKPPYTEPVHNVYIEKDNLLHRILQTDSLRVNSYHHQGIKKISERLVAVAKAEDGLIEAVVMPDKKFILAVQWHPEFTYKIDTNNYKLFFELVGACK